MSEAQPKEYLLEARIPYNPRFPNQNQTKHCWSAYVEYNKCMAQNPDSPYCPKFKHTYEALCPEEWVCLFHCYFKCN